ncbi:hypothetical protein C8J57DRAFT_1540823 [Mycena rebaudengoi]|nr:hypothetical protein C8J57DRAFT_1540823 [Mycena rebaudengoi]
MSLLTTYPYCLLPRQHQNAAYVRGELSAIVQGAKPLEQCLLERTILLSMLNDETLRDIEDQYSDMAQLAVEEMEYRARISRPRIQPWNRHVNVFTPANLANERLLGFDVPAMAFVKNYLRSMGGAKAGSFDEEAFLDLARADTFTSMDSTTVVENIQADVREDLNAPYNGVYRESAMSDDALHARIRDWLPSANSKADRCREAVVAAEEQLRDAQLRLQTAEQVIAENRGITSGLWKIPDDILLIIFREVAADHTNASGWRLADYAPWFLTHIYRYWRDTLRNTFVGKVLRVVSMHGPWNEDDEQPQKGLRTCEAVRARFDFLKALPFADVYATYLDCMQVPVWATALEFAETWTHLSVTGVYKPSRNGQELRQLLQSSTRPFGKLASLYLNRARPDIHRDTDELPDWVTERELLDVMPASSAAQHYHELRSVVLYNIVVPEASLDLPWMQLLSYTEDGCIRTNRILSATHLLSLCGLQHLTLSKVTLPSVTDIGGAPLIMANLRYFSYTIPPFRQTTDPLAAVQLPALRHLRIAGGPRGRPHFAFIDRLVCLHCCLKTFLERTGGLQQLELHWNMDMFPEHTTEILDRCPVLERLTVRRLNEGLFSPTFLSYLANPMAVPLLKSIWMPRPMVSDSASVSEWASTLQQMAMQRFPRLQEFDLRRYPYSGRPSQGPLLHTDPETYLEADLDGPDYRTWNDSWGHGGDMPYDVWQELQRCRIERGWPFLTDTQDRPWGEQGHTSDWAA